jgi:hypothetical protein
VRTALDICCGGRQCCTQLAIRPGRGDSGGFDNVPRNVGSSCEADPWPGRCTAVALPEQLFALMSAPDPSCGMPIATQRTVDLIVTKWVLASASWKAELIGAAVDSNCHSDCRKAEWPVMMARMSAGRTFTR